MVSVCELCVCVSLFVAMQQVENKYQVLLKKA